MIRFAHAYRGTLSTYLAKRNDRWGEEWKGKRERENKWKRESISFSLFSWIWNSSFSSYFFPLSSLPLLSFPCIPLQTKHAIRVCMTWILSKVCVKETLMLRLRHPSQVIPTKKDFKLSTTKNIGFHSTFKHNVTNITIIKTYKWPKSLLLSQTIINFTTCVGRFLLALEICGFIIQVWLIKLSCRQKNIFP